MFRASTTPLVRAGRHGCGANEGRKGERETSAGKGREKRSGEISREMQTPLLNFDPAFALNTYLY